MCSVVNKWKKVSEKLIEYEGMCSKDRDPTDKFSWLSVVIDLDYFYSDKDQTSNKVCWIPQDQWVQESFRKQGMPLLSSVSLWPLFVEVKLHACLFRTELFSECNRHLVGSLWKKTVLLAVKEMKKIGCWGMPTVSI